MNAPPAACRRRPSDERVRGEPSLRIAVIPEPFKDVDELLRSENGPAKFDVMIANAKPAVSWAISQLDQRHDLTTPRGAVAACEDMLDLLLRQHPVARYRYVRDLADRLGVSTDAIWTALQDALVARDRYWLDHPADRRALPRRRREFPGLRRLDHYGETAPFDCPWCASEDSAKASEPIDLWRCVVCDGSGKASQFAKRQSIEARVVAFEPTRVWKP